MKKIFSVVLLLMSIVSFAQTEMEPVIWHFETTNLEEDKVVLHITAEIFDKFHLYSQDLSEGDGPIPTEYSLLSEEFSVDMLNIVYSEIDNQQGEQCTVNWF